MSPATKSTGISLKVRNFLGLFPFLRHRFVASMTSAVRLSESYISAERMRMKCSLIRFVIEESSADSRYMSAACLRASIAGTVGNSDGDRSSRLCDVHWEHEAYWETFDLVSYGGAGDGRHWWVRGSVQFVFFRKVARRNTVMFSSIGVQRDLSASPAGGGFPNVKKCSTHIRNIINCSSNNNNKPDIAI